MILKSVELRNVKSYRKQIIEFEEGINGISGENGHGKTTILEAIGYVLFDYLPYKEADFLRRGEKSGYVSIEVQDSKGNNYILTRKLGSTSQYTVKGANLYLTGKKDVIEWIMQNLFTGVSDYHELPIIFENAVGVPQGMFTSIFMQTPTKRKRTFDEILRVDEYRDAYDELRSVMTLIEDRIDRTENEIDKLRIRTESYEEKKQERKKLITAIDHLKKLLDKCNKELNIQKSKRDMLRNQKNELDKLENRIETKRVKLEELHRQLVKSREELKKSEEAKKVIEALSEDKERYEVYKKKLEELEGMRKKRDELNESLHMIENSLVQLKEKQASLESLQKEVENYTQEMTKLESKVREQVELETKLERNKEEKAIIIKEISEIKKKQKLIGSENLCPVMKGVRCSSVKDFSTYFNKQLAKAENRLRTIEDSLKDLNAKLKTLGDPRTRVNNLNSLIERGEKEIARISKDIQKIPEKEEQAIMLRKSIDRFHHINKDIEELRKSIKQLEPRYKEFMQNQSFAIRFAEHKKEWETLRRVVDKEDGELREMVKRFNQARKGFNEDDLKYVEQRCVEIEAKLRGYQVEINEKGMQLEKLEKEISDMEKFIAKIKQLKLELDKEKRFREYAIFIRETLRDSAQHIVQEFMGEISAEANSLYCAIMDDFSQDMRWNEDYSITIVENGEEKHFLQLSGGEKMGAALAVRLALLKVMANSDFVFLDEPTQNMDEVRRGNLSEQIMNIKGFKQVFVISHDDTFNERYAHVVKIQKINGESIVMPCST